MNLALFMLGGCSENVEEPILCTELWQEDAMPLIRIPEISDRIITYEQFIDGQQMSMAQMPRNDGFGSRLEHQYILNLNSITDEDQILEFRKVFALTSCKLHYHNKQSLQNLDWDITALFGAGRPDQEIGAIELRSLYKGGIDIFWKKYYPGNPNFDFRMFYFNLDLSRIYDYVYPLVERCVSWEYARTVLNIEENQPKAGWETEYYNLFKNDPNVSIQINGGDVIGEADVDTFGSTDKTFRLSVFYLEKDTNNDFSISLESFMKFRERVPTRVTEIDGQFDMSPSGSMSGHPIITQYTNKPVVASRIDLVDQNQFNFKNDNVLALDPDLTPCALVYKRLPSIEQQQILLDMGVSQQEWETNEFIIYNPDKRILDIEVEADVADANIVITPSHISGSDSKTNVQISVPSNVSSARIRIFNYETSTEPVQEIDLYFLDCVIIPVRFWRLTLNHIVDEIWYGTIGETKNTIAPDTDTSAAINYANKLLNNQCNVYLRWIDAGAPLQEIEVTTQNHREKSEIDKSKFKFDKTNSDHHKEIQNFLNGLGAEADELNVIWTWETFLPTFGNTSTNIFTFPYPYILETAENYFTDKDGNIQKINSDEDRGRVLAHEFGHYITQRNINTLSLEEINHFDHTQVPAGHYQYTFNLMNPTTTVENELLTTEQARLINQYSRNITGSILHIN